MAAGKRAAAVTCGGRRGRSRWLYWSVSVQPAHWTRPALCAYATCHHRHKEIMSLWKSFTLQGGDGEGRGTRKQCSWVCEEIQFKHFLTEQTGCRLLVMKTHLHPESSQTVLQPLCAQKCFSALLPRKVSFLKMFSSTKVNRGNPAPSLLSSLLVGMLSPALPCSRTQTQTHSSTPDVYVFT